MNVIANWFNYRLKLSKFVARIATLLFVLALLLQRLPEILSKAERGIRDKVVYLQARRDLPMVVLFLDCK